MHIATTTCAIENININRIDSDNRSIYSVSEKDLTNLLIIVYLHTYDFTTYPQIYTLLVKKKQKFKNGKMMTKWMLNETIRMVVETNMVYNHQ